MRDYFEESWQRVPTSIAGELVSPELLPLVKSVYQQIAKQSPNLSEIKTSLESLFIYLTTSGRTSANCYATDLFFSIVDWNIDWEILPDVLTNIIGDISGALHDTFTSPDIAKNFNGLPEQILENIRKWEIESNPSNK